MGKLLYLVHRLPYPPNKGDKVRSYHLLKHLAAQHEVYLGTFVDDPEDEAYVDTVRGYCAGLHVARLNPRRAKIASLKGLLNGKALTLCYYEDAGLLEWVRSVAADHALDAAVVFSSSMAQYAQAVPDLPMLVDFVDLDSAKWTQYASNHRWPLSWIYRREGERLLACEREVAQRAEASFFVTEKEARLFREAAPESAADTHAISNGVDAEFFSPDAQRASPFGADVLPIVFTGAMDYWPNIDAATWFAQEMLPALLAQMPRLRFFIVGRSPTGAVQALAGEHVVVTGTVPDVRPYLQHAAVVVAPLRLARGIQNKILEAMAMARPVVASTSCVEAIDASDGEALMSATSSEEFSQRVLALLMAPEQGRAIGAAGRQCVLQRYSWSAHLAGIDQYLPAVPSSPVRQEARA